MRKRTIANECDRFEAVGDARTRADASNLFADRFSSFLADVLKVSEINRKFLNFQTTSLSARGRLRVARINRRGLRDHRPVSQPNECVTGRLGTGIRHPVCVALTPQEC